MNQRYALTAKAQIWYTDLIIGIVIFTSVLVISFIYITNTYAVTYESESTLILDMNKLSESLMSPGVPHNWTEDYAVTIGLLSEDRSLNTTKATQLYNMAQADYGKSKFIFGIPSDFVVYFEDDAGNPLGIEGNYFFGKPGITAVTLSSGQFKDMVAVNRFVVYRHDDIAEIITMKIFVWDEK